MDKKNQIQQLINSRKLSTDEEYVLFEGALQASGIKRCPDIHL